jgi:hypothetical protein
MPDAYWKRKEYGNIADVRNTDNSEASNGW